MYFNYVLFNLIVDELEPKGVYDGAITAFLSKNCFVNDGDEFFNNK